MHASPLLRFLFAVLISVGLAIAPLATPAASANLASDAEMQMVGMSADMPCCPHEDKQSGCQDCPLVAICMLKVLQGGPCVSGLPIREGQRQVLRPRDEPAIAGLTRPPPDQPPRTNV